MSWLIPDLNLSYRTMFNIEVFEAILCLSALTLAIIAITCPNSSGSQGSLASRSSSLVGKRGKRPALLSQDCKRLDIKASVGLDEYSMH